MESNNNKMTYFIDLDGTLFDKKYKSRVSKKNLSAMLLIKNFANIVISTGRSFHDQRVKQTLMQLGTTDIICSSGAEIYIDNIRKYSFFISNQIVQEVIDFAKLNNLILVIFDENGESFYTNNWFIKSISKLFLPRKFYLIDNLKKANSMNHNNVVKIAFVIKNKFKAQKMLDNFNEKFSKWCNATLASSNFVIEITSVKINKGLAESIYIQDKNIDVKNTVHIGDSDSDITAKGYVGKLVAMKNSSTKLKTVADEIATNYKNGGLYKYFIQKSFTRKDNDD
ncbi:HAD hydrolase family protein [Mycoplasmopsis primatum]|uniref:HAD hydrolase family protein n=1 Tax=Mycoplasmopsis primatum TaxID=55604 RepID=UPI0004980B8D|nr:HAD hydrolase family protein [Mycoplasmopsis primatum]